MLPLSLILLSRLAIQFYENSYGFSGLFITHSPYVLFSKQPNQRSPTKKSKLFHCYVAKQNVSVSKSNTKVDVDLHQTKFARSFFRLKSFNRSVCFKSIFDSLKNNNTEMRLDESALIVYDLTIDLQKSTTVLNQNYQRGFKYFAQWMLCYLCS